MLILDISLKDFQKISDTTPFLADLKPSGKYLMEDVHAVGGIPAVLKYLLEKGLIHRLTSINAYIPCCHPREGHQAAFLICTECHSVKEASAQGLIQQLDQLAASDQFAAQHSIIEISGKCHQCNTRQ